MDYNITRRILNKGKSMTKFRWIGVLLLLVLIGIGVKYIVLKPKTSSEVNLPASSVTVIDNTPDVSNEQDSSSMPDLDAGTQPTPMPIPPIDDNNGNGDGNAGSVQPVEFPNPNPNPIPGPDPNPNPNPNPGPGQSEVTPNQPNLISQEVEYTIQAGDTLDKICRNHYHDASLAKALQKYNNIPDVRKMKVNDKIKLPPIEKLGKSSPKPVSDTKKIPDNTPKNNKETSQHKDVKEHKVQKGETLGKISQKYYNTATLAKALQQYNNIVDATKIREGQIIEIPNKDKLQSKNNQSTKVNENKKDTSSQDSKYYIVQRGDNLPSIAKKLNTTPSAIMKCNPEIAENPENIKIGMKILRPTN